MKFNGLNWAIYSGQFMLLFCLFFYAVGCGLTKKVVTIRMNGTDETREFTENQFHDEINEAAAAYAKANKGDAHEKLDDLLPFFDIDDDGTPDVPTQVDEKWTNGVLNPLEAGISWLPSPFNSLGGLAVGALTTGLAVSRRKVVKALDDTIDAIGHDKRVNRKLKDDIFDIGNKVLERNVLKLSKKAKGEKPNFLKVGVDMLLTGLGRG